MNRRRPRPRTRDELVELVAYYEDILGLTEDQDRLVALNVAFGLTGCRLWLLSRLVAAAGRPLSREVLADQMPSNDRAHDRDERAVDVQLCHLRRHLGRDCVETVRGLGWRLTPAGLDRVRAALAQDAA